jgi:hypothetical protein
VQVGELVKLCRPVYGLFVVPYSAVGVIVNSKLASQEWLYSVQWSDGTRHRHWRKELETISGIG